MTILIIWGTLSSKNRGVNALARATVDVIHEIRPDEKILLIGSGQKEITELEEINFISMPNYKKLSWMYFTSFLRNKKTIKRNLYGIEINDLLVFDLSEGDSFTDIYGYHRFFSQIISKMFFLRISSYYILLPQTIGPFNNLFFKLIAKKMMAKFNLIIARDSESKKIAEKMTGKQCNFCYDMAFSLSTVQPKIDMEKIAGKIGLNVNGLLWNGGYTGKNQFNLKTDYRRLLIDICRHFLDNKYNLIIIPHTYECELVEDDLIAANHLVSLLIEYKRNISVISDSYTEQELKWIISKVEFFIGSRMHSCIAALSSGVPSVGIAYSMKFKGVFESIGANDFVLDARKLGNEEIIKEINNLFEKREELKHQLLLQMPNIKKEIFDMISNILIKKI